MKIDQILKTELTSEQYDAATDETNEILCLACAGSGKSRTLAYRIARLVAEGVPANSIVAFTFTQKATETIKRRVAHSLQKVGIDPDIMGALYIGTIHSYCQYILGEIDARYRQFDVLDENRLKLYLISRYSQLGLNALRGRANSRYFLLIKEISDAWKILNDEMLSINEIKRDDEALALILERISNSFESEQYIDFSLMIRKVVDAITNQESTALEVLSKVKYLMVDEYQDISPSQEALIKLIHERSEGLFVVGDDDQAIYAWRGADVNNILTFKDRYSSASLHTLSANFRSTAAIVEISDEFIAAELGAQRIEKNPSSAENKAPRHLGVLWFNTRLEEADWVGERIEALLGTTFTESNGEIRGLTPADFAILMRSTRSLERNDFPRHLAFTEALGSRNILFSLEAGGGPFERPQVAALRSTFELLRDSTPTREELRIHYESEISPYYPSADFATLARYMSHWGRLIHTPEGGARRRVYPQQLVYDLLEAFGLSVTPFDEVTMREIGLFSRMMQDVETVYMSVDSTQRFQQILNFLQNVAETGYDISTDDLLEKPDAVTVSTVHKAKGLEYPVVFVVDIESQRFPGNRRAYSGWLPTSVIQPALNRGAYQSTREEEARLFYTAITRAERYLYITGTERLPGGIKRWKPSDFATRLNHNELTVDAEQLPDGLVQVAQRRRVDETILPTSFSDIRYYLRCPADYRFRHRYGFSPPIPDMFGFGQSVHSVVERLHQLFPSSAPSGSQAEDVAKRVFHLKHVPQSNDPVSNPGPYERAKTKAIEIAKSYSSNYSEDFQRIREVEARFEISARDCVISGAIDLLLKEDESGQILAAEVIEFKAMAGGEEPTENEQLDWTELALQVQLYAKAAQQTLGANAKTGVVHLLKDNRRVEVPIGQESIKAAIENLEWAVKGILSGDYPMRPEGTKCSACDFRVICKKKPESFSFTEKIPPKLHLPSGDLKLVRAFSEFEDES